MSISDDAVEEIEGIFAQINELTSAGAVVLVEGDDDVRGLKKLGVRGNIMKISGGKSLLNFVEGLCGVGEVIVLTDFDRAGERLARFCSKHLKSLGVVPVTEPRRRLKELVHKEVSDIEGLSKLLLKHRESGLTL